MENKEKQQLFNNIFKSKDEGELDEVLRNYDFILRQENWKPLGANRNNYGVVKNQQSSPIAALVEKITNSIDAILTKKCFEFGINPKSNKAPESMDSAVKSFFPDSSNWDLKTNRRKQAEDIQIIADGKGPKSSKFDTSVIIYDNGEGQDPSDFEDTFLSLLKGNKNEVPFVQGKYNMGGSGSIVFCGKKKYQLIASKRHTGNGEFGFTIVREHLKQESDKTKETWYEYLIYNDRIISFPIDELELGLCNRKFTTGTVIKLYSYQFPKGYSAFSQDLNQSINEYIYSPALPILTADTKERYPNNIVLENVLYGLKRRLIAEKEDYIDDHFSDEFTHERFGKFKVTCYVFKSKVKDYDIKNTKEYIRKRYFKNSMSVLFSLNGQVHGHYKPEFITRTLKLNILRDYLLIHVDCTNMEYNFRKELFMASRDRMKGGEENESLRAYLKQKLGQANSRLRQIAKKRKQSNDLDSSQLEQSIKTLSKGLPFDSDIFNLIKDTLKVEPQEKPINKNISEKVFKGERYPAVFKLNSHDKKNKVCKIPLEGNQVIKFLTDVADDYFDRIDEPGELTISLNPNEPVESPNTEKIEEERFREPSELFDITKSSPCSGTIKLQLNPKDPIEVGDKINIQVSLIGPKDLEEILCVEIIEKQNENEPKKEKLNKMEGLPRLIQVFKNPSDSNAVMSWERSGLDIDNNTVMIPLIEGDKLERVYVNMDSYALRALKSKIKNPNEEQLERLNNEYATSVYFHTIFLYSISKGMQYEFYQKQDKDGDDKHIGIENYLSDIFKSKYGEFIVQFRNNTLNLEES